MQSRSWRRSDPGIPHPTVECAHLLCQPHLLGLLRLPGMPKDRWFAKPEDRQRPRSKKRVSCLPLPRAARRRPSVRRPKRLFVRRPNFPLDCVRQPGCSTRKIFAGKIAPVRRSLPAPINLDPLGPETEPLRSRFRSRLFPGAKRCRNVGLRLRLVPRLP